MDKNPEHQQGFVGRFTKFNGEWRESPTGIPLYTAPQLKPLSNKQILMIADGLMVTTVIAMARAIEDAHGIRESE